MSLAPGVRLGSHEITAQLGIGGMGELWRATDTNLGRQVAIKVLPDVFAQDVKRLARFEREAKTLASLNHPNIAAIFGLKKADGARALVIARGEGPTLGDRVAKGPIPIDEGRQPPIGDGRNCNRALRFSPSDPAIGPHFALAEELDIPVHIHTVGFGERRVVGRTASGMNHMVMGTER